MERLSDSGRLLLRARTAAQLLDMSVSKVYAMIQSGELPSVRLGCSVRIPADKLREHIDRQTKQA